MTRECEDCGREYKAKRSTARFCSSTCRTRARRAAKAAEAATTPVLQPDEPAQPEEPTDEGGKAEHGLVRAVRKELLDADALDTVAGQLALQIARRIADPDGAGVSTLSKELRSLLTEAKGAVAPEPDPTPTPEPEDALEEVRRRRAEQRAAAGLG